MKTVSHSHHAFCCVIRTCRQVVYGDKSRSRIPTVVGDASAVMVS